MDKHTKGQRIAAIIGIILLVAMYLTALIASFFRNSELATKVLGAALFCTVAIPILIWVCQFFLGKKKAGDPPEKDLPEE